MDNTPQKPAQELQILCGEVPDGLDYPTTTYQVAIDYAEGRQKFFGHAIGPARRTLLEAKADLARFRPYVPEAYVKSMTRYW